MDIERYKRIENKYLFAVDLMNPNCNYSLYNGLKISIPLIFFGRDVGRETEPWIDKLNIKNYDDIINIQIYGHIIEHKKCLYSVFKEPENVNWYIECSTPISKETTIKDVLRDLESVIKVKKCKLGMNDDIELNDFDTYKENPHKYTTALYDIFLDRIHSIMKGDVVWN